MKHLFIINPAAGNKDRTKDYKAQICKLCRERGLDFKIVISKAPGNCRELARQAAETGEEYRIYACGGDGTLNEVASGVAGFPNVAVTVFSGGSGNDFVKIFSETEPFFHLERLLDAEEAEFDMIRCNGDLSVNICSVGLDARIGTDVSNYKRLPLLSGFRAYAASTVVNVIRGIAEHYVIEVNGETIDGDKTMICICNGRYYGGGYMSAPKALVNDGLLDCVTITPVSRLRILSLLKKYTRGEHLGLPICTFTRGKKLTVTCPVEAPVNLDGEVIFEKEITFEIVPNAVAFSLPKGVDMPAAKTMKEPATAH